ncbi:hypothetical protein COM07_25900 [Bacillus toyonensis]|uniref:hypothetical protein n=1 Tax=Bacillus toyonensis TaxID=155322 RepID=UPI000BF6EDCC|nr:hypothetical protein [Bacillus toyonensis]PGB34894.1 hypothetical protein COM07_25900 [Bacillus toyonensis]
MVKDKIVKSVAFSNAVEYERQLLNHALKNEYFSTYIKRLIQRDMEDGVKVNINIEDKETIERLNKRIHELESALSKLEKIIKEVK